MAPGVDQKARRVISVSNSFYYVKGLAFPGCARKVIKMRGLRGPSRLFLRLHAVALALRGPPAIPQNNGDGLIVLTDPIEGEYRRQETFHRGQTIHAQALPDITFSIDELLG